MSLQQEPPQEQAPDRNCWEFSWQQGGLVVVPEEILITHVHDDQVRLLLNN